jgi:hypothetical protein
LQPNLSAPWRLGAAAGGLLKEMPRDSERRLEWGRSASFMPEASTNDFVAFRPFSRLESHYLHIAYQKVMEKIHSLLVDSLTGYPIHATTEQGRDATIPFMAISQPLAPLLMISLPMFASRHPS